MDWTEKFANNQFSKAKAKDAPINKKPEKWGLYYGDNPDYLYRAFVNWYRHGVYPNGKGLDEQPMALLNDLDTLDEWVAYWKREYERLHPDR